MRNLLPTIVLCLVALPVLSQEKQSSDNPFSAINKRGYERTKGILLRSAEKMPEENYTSSRSTQYAAMVKSSDTWRTLNICFAPLLLARRILT
jgi:hypothetical protein